MGQLSRDQAKALRKALVEKFPMKQTSIWILEDAGIPIGNIPLDDAPANNWHAIIREAKYQNKEKELIEEALDRYPNDEVFNRLLKVFDVPSDAGQPVDKTEKAEEIVSTLKQKVAKNQIQESIDLMSAISKQLAPTFQNEITHLSSRHAEIIQHVNKNSIRTEDETVEKNKIRSSLLNLIDRVFSDKGTQQKLKALAPDQIADLLG